MKNIHSCMVAAVAVCLVLGACNGGGQPQTEETAKSGAALPGTRVEILDPEALDLIDSTAVVEDLADGFTWSEGPLYIADGDYLLFSDIPANQVIKWKEGEGASVYLTSAGYTGNAAQQPKNEPGSNGLLLDEKGNLVLCQHGDRRMARMLAPLDAPQPVFETIADRYQEKRLNSPNDAVYHSNGDLYLTDPPYGLDGRTDDSARELAFHGVFRVKTDGRVDLVTNEFNYPNGIAFSPDGGILYVAHSDGEHPKWMKYVLDEQGLVKTGSVFYEISEEEKKAAPGSPDGMKVNRNGYVFASGPGGIWIFNPAGKPLARIHTGKLTSNCAFSADEKMLYMTCHDHLYRIRLK